MKTIYLCPLSHYDVVWVLTREDYLRVHDLILNKVMRMIEESDFKFLIEQAYLLERIEIRNLELFSKIKAAVAAGKIELVDGQYLMVDAMIPEGEILIRSILNGLLFCKERLGTTITVAMSSDTFGLNAQLPQILKKSGYRWLAFRRGIPASIGKQASEFIWEGLDGSQILTHWLSMGYRAGLYLDQWETSLEHLDSLATTSHIFMPCGSGGTPLQPEIPEKIAQWNKQHTDCKMQLATPCEFFRACEPEARDLIHYKGELYTEGFARTSFIFADVVSARIRIKLAVRACERELLDAEKLAALAWLEGAPYPTTSLAELWRQMLFLANHDLTPGTSIDEVYDEAWKYIEEITQQAAQVKSNAMRFLMEGIEQSDERYCLVFNSNNWKVTNWVEIEVDLLEGGKAVPGLWSKGEEVRSEVLETTRCYDTGKEKARVSFLASLPPIGMCAFQLGPRSKSFLSQAKVRGNGITTSHFDVWVEADTGILHVLDKDGNELLKGNEIVIDQELGDLYFHKSLFKGLIGSESGEGLRFGSFNPEDLTIKKGAFRTVITFKNVYYSLRWPYYLRKRFGDRLYRHKVLEVTKRIVVYDDLPRIDCYVQLQLDHGHFRVRLKFDTCMEHPVYTRETQFGAIDIDEASQSHTETEEEGVKMPSLSWLTSQEGERGVAFFTSGVPFNQIKGRYVYATLLRSVSVVSVDGLSGPMVPTPEAMELGTHHFAYALYPYKGDWRTANIPRKAYEFARTPYVMLCDQKPTCPLTERFSIEPDNLIVSVLKKAERSDEALILRLFESKGKRCHAKLCFPASIQSVASVNLMESEETQLALKDRTVSLDIEPFEILTLKLGIRSEVYCQI